MSALKTSIPNYLSISKPSTDGGWFTLGIAVGAAIGGLVYATYVNYCPLARCKQSNGKCNGKVRLSESKVVDMIDIEDIAEKAAFCRCWKTKNWPYCDGSHGEHNKLTGDNVGPVVLKRKGA